jgi:hypothetical protein
VDDRDHLRHDRHADPEQRERLLLFRDRFDHPGDGCAGKRHHVTVRGDEPDFGVE